MRQISLQNWLFLLALTIALTVILRLIDAPWWLYPAYGAFMVFCVIATAIAAREEREDEARRERRRERD